jgi:hypothetical protein
MSHHHTYYVTSSYIHTCMYHIIIHTMSHHHTHVTRMWWLWMCVHTHLCMWILDTTRAGCVFFFFFAYIYTTRMWHACDNYGCACTHFCVCEYTAYMPTCMYTCAMYGYVYTHPQSTLHVYNNSLVSCAALSQGSCVTLQGRFFFSLSGVFFLLSGVLCRTMSLCFCVTL